VILTQVSPRERYSIWSSTWR